MNRRRETANRADAQIELAGHNLTIMAALWFREEHTCYCLHCKALRTALEQLQAVSVASMSDAGVTLAQAAEALAENKERLEEIINSYEEPVAASEITTPYTEDVCGKCGVTCGTGEDEALGALFWRDGVWCCDPCREEFNARWRDLAAWAGVLPNSVFARVERAAEGITDPRQPTARELERMRSQGYEG